VYFFKVADLVSCDASDRRDPVLGSRRLQAWADWFGLGRPVGIGLPGEATGRINVPDPRNLAIGQGELMVSPLQAAQVYGRVATGGRMPPVRLIRELASPSDAARPRLNLSASTTAAILRGLNAVVNEPGGTGYGYANLPDIQVFGKSGTAETNGGDHAWFDGGATVGNPRYVFSVIFEHGGHGGVEAGPVGRDVVRALQAHGYFEEYPPADALPGLPRRLTTPLPTPLLAPRASPAAPRPTPTHPYGLPLGAPVSPSPSPAISPPQTTSLPTGALG
jgi:cell division protein FtsI/penicillin-binding protein 2